MGYKKALMDYIAATNTHDFRNVRKLLDEKAVYWFSNKTCESLDEIREYFENAWETIKDEVYQATDVQWLVSEENTACCIYTYLYEGDYNSEFVKGSGRATNVFVKKSDGKWKLIHEHLSSLSRNSTKRLHIFHLNLIKKRSNISIVDLLLFYFYLNKLVDVGGHMVGE